MLRPSILTCLVLLTSAGAVGSEETYNLKREVAWARSKWRADLKGVHFDSPIARLLAWAPPGGSIKVWLLTGEDACTPMELRRVALEHPTSRGETEVYTGKHFLPDQPGRGQTSRAFQSVTIGFEFSLGSDLCTEDIESGAPLGCGGIGQDDRVYGALSDVDSETARFGGVAISLLPMCTGPTYWLRCSGGGKRPCRRCEQVGLNPDEPEGWHDSLRELESGDVFSRNPTCQRSCPDPTPSRDLLRVKELDSRAMIWRRKDQPSRDVPSLFRTLAGCQRAQFPPAPPRK